MQVATHDLSTRRLIALIEQIGDELQRAPGWQTAVALRIGVSESTVSHLRGGTRGAGKATIQSVTASLGIDPAFFFDASLGDRPDYRAHLRRPPSRPPSTPGAPPSSPPHWDEFVREYRRFSDLSPGEVTALRGLWSPQLRIASWHDWAQCAEWVLSRRSIS